MGLNNHHPGRLVKQLSEQLSEQLGRQLAATFAPYARPRFALAAAAAGQNRSDIVTGAHTLLRMSATAESVSGDTAQTTPPGATETGGADPKSRGAHGTRRHRRHNPIKRMARKVGKILRWQVIVVALLVIVIIPSAGALALTTDATVRVRESMVSLKRVLQTLNGRSMAQFTQSDFDRLQFAVDDFTKTLIYARQRTGFLRGIQSVRPEIKPTLDALDAAQEVAMAAQEMLKGLEPTMFFLIQGENNNNSTSQSTAGERIVELLRIGQGSFVNAGNHLDAAQKFIQALDMSSLSPDLLLTAQELVNYQKQLQDLNQILFNAPDLLNKAFGLDQPADYLVLSANSDEMRPAGGFISTFGWMRVRRVHVTDYGYSPTNDTNPNPPPDDMLSQLHFPDWWTTWMQYTKPIKMAFDGSPYPDFPKTAQLAAWFYDNGKNPRSPVSGVISIDLVGFEYILDALGPVQVPEFGETVTADNFRQVIYKIREQGGFEEPHKRFLAAVYRQILGSLQTATQQNNTSLLGAIFRALREKHIMLYFKDDKLNQVVEMLGWSGEQLPARTNDYVMVADTNMSGKTNRSVIRQLTYDVQIQGDGSLQSRLSISYDYPATVAAKDPAFNPKNYTTINYFNAMQVFVPAGSTLTDTKNTQSKVETASDPDHTIFASITETEYDNTERFQFLYTTPPLVELFGPYHRYRLLLQKQAGMSGETVNVQVTLPANAQLVSASQPPVANYSLGQPILEFRTQLITDQWIEIIYTQK